MKQTLVATFFNYYKILASLEVSSINPTRQEKV